MRVVRIRHMGMRVPLGFMTMPVAMRTRRHRIMRMLVVPVVMPVRVLVLGRFVFVLVTV